ncbi:hypothetical protein BJV38_005003 [Clostridium beijerinckii]|nr:hypothetical protein [Clostridium beijerinckii]NRT48160.1 hypothetical protein [Clostridium beijerinckii]NRZ23543.1 hypothetical protein [Clostridium beijerinckii]
MCKIKCPHFIHNSHKLRIKIEDKDIRQVYLLKFCCGRHTMCNLCKED